MRLLRIISVVVLVLSLLFAGWANQRYYGGMNTDFPEIVSSGEILELSVHEPESAIFRDLQAFDATDGDLTKEIMVASVSHFLEPHTVSVKYVVFDSHNNSATLNRRVRYTDYTPPVFSLEKAPVYVVGQPFDLLDYVTLTDTIDGDISDNIRVISNMVNNFSVGNYPVVLEASNSCGDTVQLTLWVYYQSKANTAHVRLHENLIYVEQDGTFDPREWLASVTDRNEAPLDIANVEIMGNLDITKPGYYQLIYNYDDGKFTGFCPLTVVVTERGA